jgi:LEA14-like dessication related protein
MPLLHEPEVSPEDVRLRSLSLSSLELDVAIRVKNRNPVGVTVQEVPFCVLCRDCVAVRQIATGNTGRLTIPANDSTLITVTVRSDNAILLAALAALATQGSVQVTIQGTAVIDAVLFTWSVPFEKTVTVTVKEVAGSLAGEGEGR